MFSKTVRLNLFILLLVVLSLFTLAARPLQDDPITWLEALVAFFGTLLGFAAFITFVVNLLKFWHVIPDGSADLWVKYLNLVGLVVVAILQFVAPNSIAVVDQILGLLAELGGVLLPIIALLFSWPIANRFSKFTYENTKNVRFIGYSHSPKLG